MKTRFIVENFTHESSYMDLVKEIKKQGGDLLEIKRDFKYSMLDGYTDKEPVIFLGSINMTAIVQQHLHHCFPVSYGSNDKYLCSKYMTHFGEYLFNDKYSIISLKEFHRQKEFFINIYGKEGYIFLRPDSGQKTFQAKLIETRDIDRFCEAQKFIEHDLVVVSTPKNIQWEGRFVVSKDGEIIAQSTYRQDGKSVVTPSVPRESIELCNKLIKIGYYPDSIFCIDICQDSDGNYWLLEINSFSSAGLYACDKNKVVNKLSEIVENDWIEWNVIS
jgi:hypothetical protein